MFWETSQDNKYLIGYISITRQDLDIYRAAISGLQLGCNRPAIASPFELQNQHLQNNNQLQQQQHHQQHHHHTQNQIHQCNSRASYSSHSLHHDNHRSSSFHLNDDSFDSLRSPSPPLIPSFGAIGSGPSSNSQNQQQHQLHQQQLHQQQLHQQHQHLHQHQHQQAPKRQLGTIVEHVVPGSLMNIICKLKVGDEIVEINGVQLRNKSDFEVRQILESVRSSNTLRMVAIRMLPTPTPPLPASRASSGGIGSLPVRSASLST